MMTGYHWCQKINERPRIFAELGLSGFKTRYETGSPVSGNSSTFYNHAEPAQILSHKISTKN